MAAVNATESGDMELTDLWQRLSPAAARRVALDTSAREMECLQQPPRALSSHSFD